MNTKFPAVPSQDIPKVPYDFYNWGVKKAARKKQDISRIEAGIGAMDIWNLDNYMAALFANTLSLIAEQENPILSDKNQWGLFKETNECLTQDSFEEEFVFMITTFQAYAVENYGQGIERVEAALASFFTLLPYLERICTRPAYYKQYYPDIESCFLKDHASQRARFILSDYDAVSPYYHVTSTLAVGLKALAATTHGHPGDLTENEWDVYLKEVSNTFKEHSESLEPTPFTSTFIETFVKRFRSYWD